MTHENNKISLKKLFSQKGELIMNNKKNFLPIINDVYCFYYRITGIVP